MRGYWWCLVRGFLHQGRTWSPPQWKLLKAVRAKLWCVCSWTWLFDTIPRHGILCIALGWSNQKWQRGGEREAAWQRAWSSKESSHQWSCCDGWVWFQSSGGRERWCRRNQFWRSVVRGVPCWWIGCRQHGCSSWPCWSKPWCRRWFPPLWARRRSARGSNFVLLGWVGWGMGLCFLCCGRRQESVLAWPGEFLQVWFPWIGWFCQRQCIQDCGGYLCTWVEAPAVP